MSRVTQDPLAIPLAGLHLIEASAGTGKTYAIAHLVLRLVLETGLRLEQILVLTFTEAATEELRDRVNRRLRQARAVLSGGSTEDGLLADWIAVLPDPVLARARLDAALADLDQAAIYTIHGFCRRVLRDFAFESGAPFDAELITDEQDLRRTAAEDFWRRQMGAADLDEAAWLLGEFPKGPESLLDCLGGHLKAAATEILGAEPGRVRAGMEMSRELHQRLADTWPRARETVAELLRDSPALKRNIYSADAVAEAIGEMDALCDGPPPTDEPKRLALFTPQKLQAATKSKETTPEHPFFDLCGALKALDLKGLAQARRADLLAETIAFLRSELERRKRERRVLYFDDLLTQTAQALAGPRAQALADRVRKAYPQALIDEFQDTDDLQYRIFKRHLRGQPGGRMMASASTSLATPSRPSTAFGARTSSPTSRPGGRPSARGPFTPWTPTGARRAGSSRPSTGCSAGSRPPSSSSGTSPSSRSGPAPKRIGSPCASSVRGPRPWCSAGCP